ncbi:MAG TPA: VTT domain-containing protein, partial [Clostridia bacterium]|nr:VTT domain-containing protein [Clostridia bacterium]
MRKTLDPVQRKQRIVSLIGIGVLLAVLAVGSFFLGERALAWVSDPGQFRAWAQGQGVLGKLAMVGINTAQVVLAFIPGEPVEIAAGIAFGAWQGLFLVLCGTILGTCIIFLLTKLLGMRFVEAFFSREKIESLPLFQNHRRLDTLVFLLFFIPGTPKDLLTYAVGFTPMPLWRFLLLSTAARIPSVISSTWGGGAIGSRD